MAQKTALSDSDFVSLYRSIGPTELARRIGCSVRAVFLRRVTLESSYGPILAGTDRGIMLRHGADVVDVPGRINLDIENGMIVVGSDAHYWPDIVSTAHRAFVRFCKEYRPKVIIQNGDVFDGATASRHPPIGWEERPGLVQEIEACKDRLGEITVAGDRAQRIWNLGNHDSRFETRLAMVAPEYAGIHGVHLKDHFPDWEAAWSTWINDSVVVKHRFKGGIHATHNNTVYAGKTMVTGHLHSLKVTPFTDYNGTRWGVDTGSLAEPFGPQFNDYCEDNPRNWRSGFAVLTFERGELRWPEVVAVVREGVVEFRGKTYEV